MARISTPLGHAGGVRGSIASLREVRARLEAFALKVRDFTPLWQSLTEIMIDHEREWFDTEGNGTWAPLAPSTLEWKEAHGFPPDPMIRTGALFDSLTSPVAAGFEQGRSTLGTFTEKTFSWGTDVTNRRGQPYPVYHQDGPEHNPALPVRNVIEVTPALEARVHEAMDDFIRDAAREAGILG